jgi:hypothetical protein
MMILSWQLRFVLVLVLGKWSLALVLLFCQRHDAGGGTQRSRRLRVYILFVT